jgi:hypothetical protein
MTPEEKQRLIRAVGSSLQKHIEPFFIKGMELTLIATFPGKPERDCLITSEKNFDAIQEALDRARQRAVVHP